MQKNAARGSRSEGQLERWLSGLASSDTSRPFSSATAPPTSASSPCPPHNRTTGRMRHKHRQVSQGVSMIAPLDGGVHYGSSIGGRVYPEALPRALAAGVGVQHGLDGLVVQADARMHALQHRSQRLLACLTHRTRPRHDLPAASTHTEGSLLTPMHRHRRHS